MYESYEENVKKYVSQTEEAKEDIDKDIDKYQERLDTALIGLGNLEDSLADIQEQINEL